MHELKTWPGYFQSVLSGNKTFEVRENDRNFKVGDVLILKEYNPDTKEYTGRELERQVSYLLAGGNFGIDPYYCVMGLLPIIPNI